MKRRSFLRMVGGAAGASTLFLREDTQPEPPAAAGLGIPYPDRLHECMA